MKKTVLAAFICLCFSSVSAQQIVDQVMAVVGSKIVLRSDIEKQYIQYTAQGAPESEDTRCALFDELILQKLLLNQAELDSVTVSEAQVDSELDRRMRFYIRQIGSEEKLEEYFNTTIRELKAQFRSLIRDQLIVQTMQGNITRNVTATPADVRAYFNSIPPDSIPYIDAELEVAHIVIKPPVSQEQRRAIRKKLEEYRDRILAGEDFEVFAINSADQSTAMKGGELGFFERGTMVPEFEAAAFNLKPGEVSPVIETKFGFHILKLIERRGDQINVRHILLQPEVSDNDILKAVNKLDSIRSLISNGSMTFDEAAMKFSEDEDTKYNGGLLINPETNTTKLSPDKIDRALFFQVDTMPLNTVSRPLNMTTADGKTAFRIVMVKSRTKPHKANLSDDYQRIQEVALADKQNKALSEWVEKNRKSTYISINDEYAGCDILKHWN